MADEILHFATKSGASFQHIAWISDVSRDVLNSCNSSPVRDFCFRGNQQLFSPTNRRTLARLQKWLKETKGIQFSLGFFCFLRSYVNF